MGWIPRDFKMAGNTLLNGSFSDLLMLKLCQLLDQANGYTGNLLIVRHVLNYLILKYNYRTKIDD